MSESKTRGKEYQITIDYGNNEICIPTDIRDALGFTDRFSFIFRKRDAVLGITERIIFDEPPENNRAKRYENAWTDYWDEQSQLFRVKSETFLRIVNGYIPGWNRNGIYTFNGKKAEGANAVLFDLKKYMMKGEQNI